jgi:hypothetical protein
VEDVLRLRRSPLRLRLRPRLPSLSSLPRPGLLLLLRERERAPPPSSSLLLLL